MKRSMLLLAGVFASCSGSGTLSLTTWGEAFIEQEIPSSEFEDGYSVRYTKFIVSFHDFTLATKTGTKGPTQKAPYLVDVTKRGPVELEKFESVPALKYDAVSYAIAPASADSVGVGAIASADVEAMKMGGWSMWVEGTLSKAGVTKSFSWKFELTTHYENCTNPDFGEGATVPTGGTETVELTNHGDHLWYDDLQSPEAKLRGTAVASADADMDGVITQAELANVQLTTLPLGQYGTAGAGGVKTLADFQRALVRSIGHYRGEGECEARAR
ncbi:MAG: hypothetical protein ACOZQL_03995 [Myxococcota bacterium]